MAYTTKDEIVQDFKEATFTSTTNVKDTSITEFIVEADALINAYVGMKYVVPVAGGDGLNLLKLCSRSLVTARIKRIMEVKQDKNPDPSQNVTGVLLSPTAVMKILTDIRQGDASLAGATPLSVDGGFFSKNVEGDVCPVVKKDEKQW